MIKLKVFIAGLLLGGSITYLLLPEPLQPIEPTWCNEVIYKNVKKYDLAWIRGELPELSLTEIQGGEYHVWSKCELNKK